MTKGEFEDKVRSSGGSIKGLSDWFKSQGVYNSPSQCKDWYFRPTREKLNLNKQEEIDLNDYLESLNGPGTRTKS